jgi:SAM-dependent methyltransferase
MMSESHSPRVLVAIASYGEKNLGCLKQLIEKYRRMSLQVDIVVTSEAPKSIELGVDVIVGTPTKNPRSLPFAHKRLFAERADKYDLFVYTEDDIDVREESLREFVGITAALAPDEIAGFVRYEVGPDGMRYMPDIHGRFRWRPESVRRRGGYVVAEFTNEHAGFYVVTRDQLARALASGAFLSEPYEGRYEMLESAATDIYVNCGFRKVIAISHFEAFLVHHMPNRYVGQMGVPLTMVAEQIDTLLAIERGIHPSRCLCPVEPKVLESRWGKRYDERPSSELLSAIPADAHTVLSIGCGYGALEYELQDRGLAVTAFPLDSVVGAALERRRVEVIYGTLDECLERVRGRRFDCVLIPNLIHLLRDPLHVIAECGRLVNEHGALVLEGPNFERLPVLIKRTIGSGFYQYMRRFSESGVQVNRVNAVRQMVRRTGFRAISTRWARISAPVFPRGAVPPWLQRFVAETWVVEARRTDSVPS